MTWQDGVWEEAARADRSAPVSLRLVTWNVYFGGHMFEERGRGLLAELGRRRPDVAVLQEVTPELLDRIARARWVRDAYQLSDVDGRTIGDYGVLVLSRLPIRKLSVHELPTAMGRRLVIAELGCGLTIATVHLESLDEADARTAQLAIVQRALRDAGDAVVAGDLNFAPGAVEETAIEPGWLDAWPALRGAEPGYTVDTDRNAMRAQLKSTVTHKRIDRVLVRSTRWRATAIDLIGTAAIDVDETFVSDHFGLEAALTAV